MNKEDLDKSIEHTRNFLKNLTDKEWKEIEERYKDDTPKGWLSIEEHLPAMSAGDFCEKGYSSFKVRDKDGKEFESRVCDGNMWYYDAKEVGITHWLNEEINESNG